MFGLFIPDQYWWLMLPDLALGLYAQLRLSATYRRYVNVPVETGLSGAQVAREILDRAGLNEVAVAEVAGHLTDHYDPMRRALFLSSENYSGRSLAAVGVAAHEAGHALQHQAAYAPLRIRMALVPVTSFASQAVLWMFVLGMFMNMAKLVGLAIVAYTIITLFQAITLPVEFDASRRAKAQLLRIGIGRGHERDAVGKVLNAAALTYVAAMVQSVMTLLHFILIARSNDRE
ncbi:MAG: zinc metallopeptidase [Verrucomicrobia bacterium]|nr:zinc metallopeptidase [Verrucomicrobiota bacterium]